MQKLIAKILINTLPLPVIAEIVQDKRRQDARIARHLKRWEHEDNILEASTGRLWQ